MTPFAEQQHDQNDERSAIQARSRRVVWLSIGAVVLAVLLICGGWIGVLLMTGSRSLKPPVRQYLEHVDAGDLDAAWAMTTNDFKLSMKRDQFDLLHRVVWDAMGRYRGLSLVSFNINKQMMGETHGEALFRVTFEQGQADFRVAMVKDEGTWRLYYIYFGGPRLVEALRCEACGHGNTTIGWHCSNCGKPMHVHLRRLRTDP